MTLAEIKSLIDTYYPDNLIGLVNPAGERIVLKALADFMVSSQGESDTTSFVYDSGFSYAADDPVIYNNAWYLSLAGANINNQPDTSPSEWEPVNAYNNVLSIYEEGAVYLGLLSIVIRDGGLYQLDRDVVGDGPFVSTDFETELTALKWVPLLEGTLSADTISALAGNGGTPGPTNKFVTEQGLTTVLESIDFPTSKRKVSAEYIILSATSGTLILGEWYNDANEFKTVSSQAITFSGTPTAGNLRWDVMEGREDGTAVLVSGTPGTSAVRPSVTSTAVVLFEVIWNEEGEAVEPPSDSPSVWSEERFATAVNADTTGKYCKIMEMDCGFAQDYSFILDYAAPASLAANKVGSLHVAFVCTEARIIHSPTVKITTVGFSEAGDFVLVQLADNKAALYHKSTNYWMRLQWRVTFHNTAMALSNFKQGEVYGSLPAGDNWQSVVNSGGASLPTGGTIGQALIKNSSTDGDASWKNLPGKIYNVEDYGAVHDGTTDDTLAIQAAINAVFAAGGGRVYFPQGVYIIGGALLTDVGGINYNSQIYIPQANFISNLLRTTIELVGEFQPNLIRSVGISVATEPNSGVVLLSTIQGSGTEPAVIKSKGAASNFMGISYTCLQVKNISVQVTPNGSNKITMGGICAYNSAIANFEYVTCYPYNLNLVNSGIPDVIDVTGIALPKEATEHINTIRNCTVGGFTNGYKVGEHASLYDVIANCCVNGFLITENNHLPNLSKVSAFWCINAVTVNPTAATFPGGYYFLIQYLAVEWKQASKWYDSVNIINDPSDHGFGKVTFDIVAADIGVDNTKFKKVGGSNIVCEPITVNVASQVTTTPYTLKYTDGFRKNKMNMGTTQVITIPPFSSVTFDIDQEIVIQRLGSGDVEIVAGSGVTLNIPSGFLAKIKGQYDAVSLVQVAVNSWVIYGALTPTP